MKIFTNVPDVFLYRDFVDFRKSINGLSAIVEQQMQLSRLSPYFVFIHTARSTLSGVLKKPIKKHNHLNNYAFLINYIRMLFILYKTL